MPELAEALGLSSLVAGSLEYAILIRHRQERRMRVSFVDDADAAAREALARVSQRENRWPMRRWTADGTRFRIESAWPRWPSRRG
jgi:hypothetical protein